MSNAAIKYFALASAMLCMACSSGNEKEKANALYNEAAAAVENNDFNRAIMLVDSLKSAYPGQIDIRRNSLHILARANEGLALRRLESADSLVAVIQVDIEAMSNDITEIDNPVEKYYVVKGTDPSKFYSKDGLQARMSPDGDLYLISSLASRKVQSTSIAVECDGRRAVTATVAHDGERNDRSMGSEVITFMGAECDSVARFIAENADRKITLIFEGSKPFSMTLPESQANEIATLTRYAGLVRQLKGAMIEREKQSRILETARSQAARTFNESNEGE